MRDTQGNGKGMYTADIDIGGTFTDGFFTSGGEVRRSKVLTTPHDLTECFLNCIIEGAAQFEVPLKVFMPECLVIRLSTTLGTNTLIQQRGPKIGLLVTRGHEHDLYGEGESALFGLCLRPEMVIGVGEHVDDTGLSVYPPDSVQVLTAVRDLVGLGARMVAVSFAGSGKNPAHEKAIREIVRARYPEHYLRSFPLQLGHEVSPTADDLARTNTVVLNAYLHAELARGLFRAEDRAREHGFQRPLLIVHASGGCARVAKTVAVQTLSSGPAVAINGAATMARQLGLTRVVTADMGGTSLDVAILDGAAPAVVESPRIAGVLLALPMLETASIGAGGGSIARLVDSTLEVGPESAGSTPGPACYDKGGSEPTVTDANLLLGFLDPDRFLGGRMKLSRKRAEDAFTRRLARRLQRPIEELAAEVRSRIDERMAADIAARIHALGANASDFTLFAVGGGGPLHGCSVASRIGIKRVVGFPFGSVFSAFGSSTVDLQHRYHRRLALSLESDGLLERIGAALADLRLQAERDMRGEGFSADAVHYGLRLVVGRVADAGTIEVPLGNGRAESALAGSVETLRQRANGSGGITELSRLVLEARVTIPHWLPEKQDAPHSRAETAEQRAVRWTVADPAVDTAIFALGDLRPGAELEGPAIVESPDTLYAVPSGWRARVDPWGNLCMECE